MATLKELLIDEGFKFTEGTILYQSVLASDDDYSSPPGWAYGDEVGPIRVIKWDHPVLSDEFDTGYGSPHMPRFMAYDDHSIYFPGMYDGATFIIKVPRHVADAMGMAMTTYVGN